VKRSTFSEDEARRILARASERQEAAERARLGSGEGVSLTELKEIADEVGIEASHVQAAAGELVLLDGASPPEVRFGLPMELSEVRMLPGTVSDRQWEQMVGVFRETFGLAGMTTHFGDVREWMSSNVTQGGMNVRIRLEPGSDGTLFEMSQSTKGILGVGTGLAISFGGMGAVLAGILAVGAVGPRAWVLSGLLLGLGVFSGLGSWLAGRSFVKKRTGQFDAVADKVELIGRPEDG